MNSKLRTFRWIGSLLIGFFAFVLFTTLSIEVMLMTYFLIVWILPVNHEKWSESFKENMEGIRVYQMNGMWYFIILLLAIIPIGLFAIKLGSNPDSLRLVYLLCFLAAAIVTVLSYMTFYSSEVVDKSKLWFLIP